ncbi:MAG: tetratricopeptide repeat protein [Gracilibacteraceae bacterium]|jgi:tetratricopeptide (TPR) repeat protein|nr:tetratricopeptide repeat protein [Gracilibacteraceae bacterium]
MSEAFYAEMDAVYAAAGKEGAEQFLQERRAQALAAGGQTHPDYILVVSELGNLYRGLSRYAEALTAYNEAATVIAAVFGENSPNYASNLVNTAGAYRMMGDSDAAWRIFNRAIAIYESLAEVDLYLYAGALHNMASLCQSRSDFAAAISWSLRAVALLEERSDLAGELAVACSNLSALYQSNGQPGEAAVFLDRALSIWQESGGGGKDPHYAAALNNKALRLAAQQELDGARALLEEARTIVRRYFGANADYASLSRNLAHICRRSGDTASALVCLREAEDAFTQVFGPEHPQVSAIRSELAAWEQARGWADA